MASADDGVRWQWEADCSAEMARDENAVCRCGVAGGRSRLNVKHVIGSAKLNEVVVLLLHVGRIVSRGLLRLPL